MKNLIKILAMPEVEAIVCNYKTYMEISKKVGSKVSKVFVTNEKDRKFEDGEIIVKYKLAFTAD